MLIVDLWQYCVCCIGSGVNRCIFFMVFYQRRIYQRELHVVLSLHIGILKPLFDTLPLCTAGPSSPSHCNCGTILLTLYSMERVWRVSRAGSILFYWPRLRHPFLSSTIFLFLFFWSIGLCCGAGVFGLIGCTSLSPSLELPTSFNNKFKPFFYY